MIGATQANHIATIYRRETNKDEIDAALSIIEDQIQNAAKQGFYAVENARVKLTTQGAAGKIMNAVSEELESYGYEVNASFRAFPEWIDLYFDICWKKNTSWKKKYGDEEIDRISE